MTRTSLDRSRRPFLTAEWRCLTLLNSEIDPDVLRPLVPPGTELDHWQGRTFVSMVGFLFLFAFLIWVSGFDILRILSGGS